MLDKIIKDLEKLQSISNVDEESAYFNAIQIIKQHGPQHPTITDSEIELLAKDFRKENLLSVSFTPDVHSFTAGAKAVLSMMPQSEGWVKVEDVLQKLSVMDVWQYSGSDYYKGYTSAVNTIRNSLPNTPNQ